MSRCLNKSVIRRGHALPCVGGQTAKRTAGGRVRRGTWFADTCPQEAIMRTKLLAIAAVVIAGTSVGAIPIARTPDATPSSAAPITSADRSGDTGVFYKD